MAKTDTPPNETDTQVNEADAQIAQLRKTVERLGKIVSQYQQLHADEVLKSTQLAVQVDILNAELSAAQVPG